MVDGGTRPSSDRAPDPLGELRRAIDDLHRSVDERSALGAAGLDVHRYAGSLLALARVLPGVEHELIRCGDERFRVEPITPLLLDDVVSLGLDLGDARAPASTYDDPGAWWGAAYVLHGSRLGATVIADRLAADLPAVPRSYFAAAARGAAPAWARFRSVARCAWATEGVDLGRSVDAARSVFRALLVELDQTMFDQTVFNRTVFDQTVFNRTVFDQTVFDQTVFNRTVSDRNARATVDDGRVA